MFPRTSSPKFPIEICERIIDHAPPETIQTCVRVCRSWVPRSRFHLFRDVRLDSNRVASMFLFSLEISPILATYVRVLRIDGKFSSHEWIYDVLRTLPPLAVNIRSLCFYSLPLITPDFWTLTSRFTTITALVLVLLPIQPFRNIIQLFNSFQDLQHVEIRFCNLTFDDDLHPDDYSRSHNFKMFKLDGFPSDQQVQFSRWILTSNSFHSLSTLEITSHKPSDELNQLLQRCSKTLQALCLQFLGNDGIFLSKSSCVTVSSPVHRDIDRSSCSYTPLCSSHPLTQKSLRTPRIASDHAKAGSGHSRNSRPR